MKIKAPPISPKEVRQWIAGWCARFSGRFRQAGGLTSQEGGFTSPKAASHSANLAFRQGGGFSLPQAASQSSNLALEKGHMYEEDSNQ